MEVQDGACYREKFRNFVAWAEPDSKQTVFFAFLEYPSTVLRTAYRKQFTQTNGTDGKRRL